MINVVKAAFFALALLAVGSVSYWGAQFHAAMDVFANMGREPYRKPEIVWKCGETIIGWANEDSGYESGSGAANDEDNTIVVRNAPRGTFVLVFHTTAHAFSTWGAKLDGKWCDRDYNLTDELGGTERDN